MHLRMVIFHKIPSYRKHVIVETSLPEFNQLSLLLEVVLRPGTDQVGSGSMLHSRIIAVPYLGIRWFTGHRSLGD